LRTRMLRSIWRIIAGGCLAIFITDRLSALDGLPKRFIPEFDETEAVVLSEYLFEAEYHGVEIVRELLGARSKVWILINVQSRASAIKALLKKQGLIEQDIEKIRFFPLQHSNLWLRDFGPFPVQSHAMESASNRVEFFDFEYRDPSGPANDLVPKRIAQDQKVRFFTLPYALDGGNFLTDGDACLTSHLEGSPSVAHGLQKFLETLACRPFLDLSNAPHVHIDMWVKFVRKDSLFVHEIDEHTLAVAKKYFGSIPADLLELKQVLDQKARELGQQFKVQRLPLPMPYRNVFRSYTNAILVNGTAILPSYTSWGWTKERYPDDDLKGYYESKVQEIYERNGYRVRWIQGDTLIFNGGAFRCASFQIPRKFNFKKKGF
jgi:agmatine/peptidylarginine deiminase